MLTQDPGQGKKIAPRLIRTRSWVKITREHDHAGYFFYGCFFPASMKKKIMVLK